MKKILVIEDEDLIRESIEDLLLFEGFEVITAENGKKGVYLATQTQPDLILCDVMMPMLNGYEVLEQVRQNQALSTVPFLFLTSMMDRRSNRKGMSLGADDYLEKPCTKDELLGAIAIRLEKQKIIKSHMESKMEDLRKSIALSLPHELQTPLTGIMGLSELMMLQREEMTSDDIYECSEAIYHSSKRLHRLIQNYLLYSKLLVLRSQGANRLKAIAPCNSLSIINDLSERKAKLYERLDDLEMELVDLDVPVMFDDFTKIADELMDNAFKYSRSGTKISLHSHVIDSQWIFTIKDHGRGMTKEQVANIGAYMQFDRGLYEQQGMGLGLILSKTLVEFYGGNIDIQSENQIGTKIEISIPIYI